MKSYYIYHTKRKKIDFDVSFTCSEKALQYAVFRGYDAVICLEVPDKDDIEFTKLQYN